MVQFDVRGYSYFFGFQLLHSNSNKVTIHYKLEETPVGIWGGGFHLSTIALLTQCGIKLKPNKSRFLLHTQLPNRIQLCLNGTGTLRVTKFTDSLYQRNLVEMLPCQNFSKEFQNQWSCFNSSSKKLDNAFVFLETQFFFFDEQVPLPHQFSWAQAHSVCQTINSSLPSFTRRQHFQQLHYAMHSQHFLGETIQAIFIGLYRNATVSSFEKNKHHKICFHSS